MHHPTADRPIEHPSGRFQTTCAFLTRLRAAQNAHTAPLHRFMYEHRPAKPRMPGIKNFPFLGPVGVMLSSCIMRCELTFRLGRTRPTRARSSDMETLSCTQSLEGYTIDTRRSSFRKRHHGAVRSREIGTGSDVHAHRVRAGQTGGRRRRSGQRLIRRMMRFL